MVDEEFIKMLVKANKKEVPTVGVYVNAITKRSEEEILLLQGMYLGLLSYPYKDIDTGKIIYECQLITGY